MPKPTPQEEDPQVAYKKWSGVKNTVTRERLTAEELEYAINIDLDDVGQPHRRRGVTQLDPSSWGNLWNDAAGNLYGTAFYSGVNHLYKITGSTSNFSLNLIDNTVPYPIKLGYVHPAGDMVYVTGGHTGYAVKFNNQTLAVSKWQGSLNANGQNYWFSPVVNPTPTLPAIRGRLLGPPPSHASILAYWNGRIYMAAGRTLWLTLPYLYDYVDKTRDYYQFDAETTLVGAVSDGVYVGTAEGVWFLSGNPAEGLKRVRVMDTPAIPGTMVYIPGELANPPQVNLGEDTNVKVSIAFMTQEGYCGGMDGGECYNYTEDRVIFPKSVWGAAAFRRQDGMNHYIASLNSEGDPVAGGRIGDYLDGELVPAGTWREMCDRVQLGDAFLPTWS
jgi:hypothetical protein